MPAPATVLTGSGPEAGESGSGSADRCVTVIPLKVRRLARTHRLIRTGRASESATPPAVRAGLHKGLSSLAAPRQLLARDRDDQTEAASHAGSTTACSERPIGAFKHRRQRRLSTERSANALVTRWRCILSKRRAPRAELWERGSYGYETPGPITAVIVPLHVTVLVDPEESVCVAGHLRIADGGCSLMGREVKVDELESIARCPALAERVERCPVVWRGPSVGSGWCKWRSPETRRLARCQTGRSVRGRSSDRCRHSHCCLKTGSWPSRPHGSQGPGRRPQREMRSRCSRTRS